MFKFKNNREELLKELQKIISQSLDDGDINPEIEEDVAEFLTSVKDKRHLKKLKSIRKELDKWLEDIKSENKSKSQSREHFKKELSAAQKYANLSSDNH